MGKIKFLSICYCMIAGLMMVACGGGNAAPTPTPTPTPTPSNNSVPVVTSLSPSSVIAGAGATTVTINGSGFISSSSVQWGTAVHASTPVSGTQIQVALSASEVATAGSATVTVTNPAPGGGTSTSSTFTVNNPAPVVSAISPATVMVGSIGSTITVSGSGFVSGSVVNFNGSPRTTTFSSSTSLRAALTAADYQTSGVPQITVSNPAPGGGTSSASTAMSVINPTPVLSNLSPSNVTAGSAQTVVTLNGSGFMAGSVVRINGAARSATFVSSTKINVTLTAAELANPTSLQFTVSNAGPGGGTSYGLSFAVRGATPTITIYSMSPSMLPAGYGDFSLFVTASGLTYNTQATWNGSARQTYAVDPYYGYLLILIDAADIQNPGSAQVVLSDPTTGAVSAPQSFIITAMGIVSVDPNEIYAGSAATTLDVKGGGFNSGAIVQWNGAPLATTFVSAGELTAIVPASDLAVVADASVTVLNPDNSVSNEIPVPAPAH